MQQAPAWRVCATQPNAVDAYTKDAPRSERKGDVVVWGSHACKRDATRQAAILPSNGRLLPSFDGLDAGPAQLTYLKTLGTNRVRTAHLAKSIVQRRGAEQLSPACPDNCRACVCGRETTARDSTCGICHPCHVWCAQATLRCARSRRLHALGAAVTAATPARFAVLLTRAHGSVLVSEATSAPFVATSSQCHPPRLGSSRVH